MSQAYDRWYILPPAPDPETDGRIPKYTDGPEIGGFAGNLVDSSVVGDNYAGLVATYPDVDEWYIARVYGSWSALNGISVKGDSRNLASHPAHVKAVLDQRFPDLDTRSAEEWASVFRVGE